MTIVRDRNGSVGAYTFPDNYSVSDNATRITYIHVENEMSDKIRQSERWSRIIDHVLGSYNKAMQEGARDNWDGYGAKPINRNSWHRAIAFAELLSSEIPVPDIYMDTNGEATFEWYLSARNVFSVTLSGEKDLVYAGLFGPNKAHGVEQEINNELPNRIVDLIYRVYGD